MEFIEFNMNHQIKVKLTELGKRELQRQHDEFELFPSMEITEDENGYSSWQAWVLFSKLGHRLHIGFDSPFELDVLIEAPKEPYKDWLPTSENINALPEPVRKYIHDLQNNCDPSGLVQDVALLKETVAGMKLMLDETNKR